MNASRRVCLLLVSILVVLLGAQSASAQVSLTTLGSPTPLQTFDSLINTGSTTWTNNSTIPGWFHARTGTGTTIVANDGSSNAGNLYSYGTGTNTDRALGSLGSGNAAIGNLFWGVRLQNNTGGTITSLDVQYVGEQWRNSAAAAQTIAFSYLVGSPTVTGSLAEFQSAGVAVVAGDFTSPITGGVAAALNGNLAANRTTKTFSITGLSIPNGTEVMLRWSDPDHTGADHGLSIDDFVVTPQGSIVNAPVVPSCATPLTTTTGTATSEGVSATDADGTVTSATITGITPVNPGTITLTGFTPAGGVGGTANATLSVSAATPANTYSVTIQWANNDGSPQTANCVVSVVVNAPPVIAFIHDVQGNGAATPVPGSTVTIEGVVIGDYQGSNQLSGFFLQEEATDADADPLTSEGIFVFCSACPTAVAEGQRVQATGVVSEFNNMTEVTASTAPSVVITNAGNNLALVTPSPVDLPIVGVVNDFYEAREGMLVHFIDPLIVSEYFELPRFGHLELFEGGRPLQYTETNPPSVAGNTAYLAALDARRVILDDDNNNQNGNLTPFQVDGMQFVFHPRANGGFSVGTQGVDFFRGGDQITSLTGVLHWSFPGVAPDTWRIRPTAATPATFTVNNPRPAVAPTVGGAIKAAGLNLLNYFTTIDTTSSSSSGPCGPSGTQDCRGADSVAELNRQRARAALVLCTINADVYGLMELENTTPSDTINDLLGAVNTQCGGAHPYTFVNTGGTLGTDAIRVELIYRTGVLSPVGAALVDLDPVHNRPPTAQTFDVVDALNPAFGKRFTVIANHFKSKSPSGATGGDVDTGDGQGAYSATRTAQATRLLTWINSTVVPAAGDPDVLLLGDFNSYAQETPVTTITGGGYTDVSTALLGSAGAYSYLFDGMLGHLDFAFASASLMPQITGAGPWHINADEAELFDYNDEVKDVGEAAFEEKPDGSSLVPPRVVFAPGAYRAADHDPVTLGLFAVADVSITKTDSPDPVNAGTNLTYTITVDNGGPDVAATSSWSDTIPAGTTFVSISSVAGWSCSDPGVGNNGLVSCSNPAFAVGSAVFTLVVHVDPTVVAGTVLSNTATATSTTGDPDSSDLSDTETTTVAASADLVISKTDSPDPVTAGTNLTYQMTLTNNGPSNAASATFSDTLPAGTTFVSLSTTGPWSCTDPGVGNSGTVSCTNTSFGVTVDFFTIVVKVDPSVAAGTVLSNTATMASTTSDPSPGNESDTATTTVAASADLQISKTDTPDPVDAGSNITYQLTLTNNGPSNAASATFSDPLPAGTTFVSLSTTGPWSCTTPAVGSGGTVSCTNTSFGVTVDFFTIVVKVDPSVAAGTVLTNTATLASATSDPNSGNESDTATTTVATSADIQVTKTDSPDPVTAGTNLTYTITVLNAGPSDAATVALADTVPANTTFVSLSSPGGWSCTTPAVGGTGAINCSTATIPAGGSGVFTLVVNVNAATADGTILSNTATGSTATTDPTPGNDSATATTTVGVGSADVSVTKTDSPDPISAGSTLTYTITVANAGPSDATNVTLADTVPTGTTFLNLQSPGGWSCSTPGVGGTGPINCSIASFLVGGNAVFTLLVQVNSPLATGTVITNTATVASTTADPSGGNNSATSTTTVQPITNFTATKAVSGSFVSGTAVTYTVILTNNMGFTQNNNFANEFADILPAGLALTGATASTGTILTILPSNIVTWNGSIPNGTSVTITITATIIAPSGSISNQGNAIIDTDNSGLNESAVFTDDPSTAAPGDPTVFTIVPATADLSVTKTDSPDPVTAGTNLTYTITVNNAGPNNASTVSLSDTLPANTSFVSLPAVAGWSCTTPAVGAGGTVTCTNPTMAVGSAVFTLTVSVSATAGGGTVISNTATVTSATSDPNTGNESDTETTNVISPATVTGTKTAPGTVAQGSNVTYTIVLSNSGPAAQGNNPGDEFVDVLPSQLTLISANATTGTAVANVGTNTVTWNGSIPAGGSVTITIVALVESSAPVGSTITNQGTINYDADGNGTNEASAVTDDSQPGTGTSFIVGAPAAATSNIPALDPRSLIVLATLLAAIGVLIARRS